MSRLLLASLQRGGSVPAPYPLTHREGGRGTVTTVPTVGVTEFPQVRRYTVKGSSWTVMLRSSRWSCSRRAGACSDTGRFWQTARLGQEASAATHAVQRSASQTAELSSGRLGAGTEDGKHPVALGAPS
jgi:hypothetical protein